MVIVGIFVLSLSWSYNEDKYLTFFKNMKYVKLKLPMNSQTVEIKKN